MTNDNFIQLNNVRIVYASLFEPKIWIGKDGKPSAPKFECTFILDKDVNIKEINTINARTNELLLPYKTNKDKLAQKGYKYIALRDPQVLEKQLDAYDNSFIIKATANGTNPKYAPTVLDKDGKTRVTNKNRFYDGCYVNAYISLRVSTSVELYVSANLGGVQFANDGEQIGGIVFNPEGMFAPVAEESSLNDSDVPF